MNIFCKNKDGRETPKSLSTCWRKLIRSLMPAALAVLTLGIAGTIATPTSAFPALGNKYQDGEDITTDWGPYDAWLGSNVLYRNSYSASDDWPTMDRGWWGPAETSSIQWLNGNPNRVQVISLGVVQETTPGDFASVYNGGHDADFQAWAQQLIDSGVPTNRVIIRLGHEFNGPDAAGGNNGHWYPWQAGNRGGEYAKAFHHVVQLLRSKIPGLKICWNPGGKLGFDWQSYWPTDNNGVAQNGDVDYIGLDIYDDAPVVGGDGGWGGIVSSNPGLNELYSFCVAKGKLFCVPEWGLKAVASGGHGDNTVYIQQFHDWFMTHDTAWQGYWNNTCCGTLRFFPDDGSVPNSRALFKSLFGNGTGGVPSAPTGVGASAGNTQITLNWTAASGATSYNVYRGTASGGESTTAIATGVTGTSYTNTGLTNGQIYWYRLKSVNASGTSSSYSNEASATPAAGGSGTDLALNKTITASSVQGTGLEANKANDGNSTTRWASAPTSPQWIYVDLGSTASISEVKLNWETAFSTNYTIQTSNDASNWANIVMVTGNASSGVHDYTGLSGSGRYVRVNSTTGNPTYGLISLYDFSVYGAGSPPAAPTGLTATGGQSAQIPLSWTAASGATSYNVYRGTTSGGESTTAIATGVTGTTYTNTGLTNGQIYYYRLKSVNASGTSASYSNEASATPVAAAGNTHAGTWAMKAIVGTSPTYNGVLQGNSVTANTAYTARAWVKGSGKLQFNVVNSGFTGSLASMTVTATSTWTQVSLPFNSGSNTTVSFQFYDSIGGVAGTVYLDDFFLGAGTNLMTNPGLESGNTGYYYNTSPSLFNIVQNP